MKIVICIFLFFCGLAASFLSLIFWVLTIVIVHDAWSDSDYMPIVSAEQVRPENDGCFVRVRGALTLDEDNSYTGRLGAYRVSFVNEFTCDYLRHTPETSDNVRLVAKQQGDLLIVWYNLTNSPVEWYLSAYAVPLSASEYVWLPHDAIVSFLGALLFFVLSFLCFRGAWRKDKAELQCE